MAVDYLANTAILGAMLLTAAVYCSVALSPAWDDGTGFAVPLDSPDRLTAIKRDAIPRQCGLWVANLSFALEAGGAGAGAGAAALLFDPHMELGRALVARVTLCRRHAAPSSPPLLCACGDRAARLLEPLMLRAGSASSAAGCVSDSGEGHAALQGALRALALREVVALERVALDSLVIRLRHYFQSGAGVDALLVAAATEGVIELEHASTAARHTSWLRQRRLPPPLPSRGPANLVFVPADRDDRWVYDLSMDPQANVLKHAPFVFPVLLVAVTCAVRMLVARRAS